MPTCLKLSACKCAFAGISKSSTWFDAAAGSPLAYRSDESWMGLSGRLPSVKPPPPCATVVGSALSSVLEASLASLQGVPASGLSLSPTYAYFCAPTGARTCTTGWSNDEAAHAVTAFPAVFFATATCAGSGTFSAASCSATAGRCGSRPVSGCTVEALDAFYSIQRAIRRNGAALSSLIVDGGFQSFFAANPDGVYNATVNPNANGVLTIAVALVG